MSFTSTPNEFVELSVESRKFGETNDCAVKAVALVCNVPYATAHATLKALGRKDRKGTWSNQYMTAVKQLGKTMVRVNERDLIAKYPSPHNNLRSVTSHHPRRFAKAWDKNKVYFMITSRHAFAVVNGETKDWSINKSLRVRWIYEVI
jgi:hypothetical protein